MVAPQCECTKRHRAIHLHVVTMVKFHAMCISPHFQEFYDSKRSLRNKGDQKPNKPLTKHSRILAVYVILPNASSQETWLSRWLFTVLLIPDVWNQKEKVSGSCRNEHTLSNWSPWEVPWKCELPLFSVLFLASSHLWEVSVQVLMCNGRICDKFKEFPHSHHSNTVLQKEICWKENAVHL